MGETGGERKIFGGADPEDLAAAVGDGYAVWVDTDGRDEDLVDCQGGVVVNAPVEKVYETAVDVESYPHFMRTTKKARYVERDGERMFTFLVKQNMGFSFLPIGFKVILRCLCEPPTFIMGEYVEGPVSRMDTWTSLTPLKDGRTLLVQQMVSPIRDMSWLARFLFKHQPEFEFAANSAVALLGVLATKAEAERRVQAKPTDKTAPPPLSDLLAEKRLYPAVEHGYLSIARVEPGSSGLDMRYIDISSAARTGAVRQAVWDICYDPGKGSQLFHSMKKGRLISKDEEFFDAEFVSGVKYGVFGRTYHVKGRARYEEPSWYHSVDVRMDGHPVQMGANLFEEGENTLYCYKFYADPKNDWLSRKFLGTRPEYEALLNCCPSIIAVRGFRQHFGPPRP